MNKMRILFIYPIPPEKHIPKGYNFGIGYCSAVLKLHNHKTDLIILDKPDLQKIKRKILQFKPELICVSTTTDQFKLAKEIIKYIYNKYKFPIIIGGVHPTIAPEEAIEIEGISGVCVGEGEYALLEFIENAEKGKPVENINNFWIKKRNGKIIKNSLRPLIQNLDELPFCDREIFGYEGMLKKNGRNAEFIAGRGCPFSCNFCINHVLQKIYEKKGKYVRIRSVDNLIGEIEEVCKRYNPKTITFHDDTFTLNREWIKKFCNEYRKKIKIPFRCNVRADTIDEEILALLKKAGCDQVWVGVESGEEELRNGVLNKKVTTKKIIEAFRLIKKFKIKSRAFNMIGVPFETCETAQKTIDLNKEIGADLKCLTVFRPYPGTKLYKLCKKNGWISKREVRGYYEDSILDQPSISSEDVYFYHKLYFYSMYIPFLVPLMKPIHKIKIFNRSLFHILQPKEIFYFLNFISKKL